MPIPVPGFPHHDPVLLQILIARGRRALAAPAWKPVPGMLFFRVSESSGTVSFSRLTENYPEPDNIFEWIPDTSDHATRGAMLGVARKAVGDPNLAIVMLRHGWAPMGTPTSPYVGAGKGWSEEEAYVEALWIPQTALRRPTEER